MFRPSCLVLAALVGLSTCWARAADTPADNLQELLSSGQLAESLRAVDRLGQRGPRAKAAVPLLSRALGHETAAVRARAARSLGAIGPQASAAVPALTKALGDQDPQVRAYAAFALGSIGQAAAPAVGKLLELTREAEGPVRLAAWRALRQVQPPVEQVLPAFLAAMKGGDTAALTPALQILAAAGPAAVPHLQTLLKDKQAAYWACVVLADLGSQAAPAVPDLTTVLQHGDPEVRLQALIALGEIGPAAKPAVPAVLRTLTPSELTGVRYAAVYALGQIGELNPAVQEALAAAAQGSEPLLKLLALWAQARLKPSDEVVVRAATEALVAALKAEQVELRRAAARALHGFAGPVEITRPALFAALKDADAEVRGNAASALLALGPNALPHVAQALQDPDTRAAAVRLVYRLGEKAAPAVPALVQILTQAAANAADLEFRSQVQLALAAIGPAAKAAVPELVNSLASDDEAVRGTACYALGRIGPAAQEALPALRQRLRDRGDADKVAVVWALLKIQPTGRLSRIAAPILIQALNSEQEVVRAEAAKALGELGDAAQPAVERLRTAANDESELVREAAAAALRKLGAGE